MRSEKEIYEQYLYFSQIVDDDLNPKQKENCILRDILEWVLYEDKKKRTD